MVATHSNPTEISKSELILWALIFSLAVFFLLYKLDTFPAVWWDEGWTLDAARNWIQNGHLGHYINGRSEPPRIPVRSPIALPVTLSMTIFGIGVWQGRLPSAIFTLVALGLTAYLAAKIYNRKIGLTTIIVLLFLLPYILNPIYLGRQILAEMPMILYLFMGYCMTWLAFTRSTLWAVCATIFFGIAIHAKLQVPPFWLVSLILAIWVSIRLHQRRSFKILIVVMLGSIATAGLFYWVQNQIMPGSFNEPELLTLLFNSVIVVPHPRIRLIAIILSLLFAFPQLLSYIWAGRQIIPALTTSNDRNALITQPLDSNKQIMMVAIWGLGSSWFLWYLLLGLSWERYIFPPVYIGCIFVAALINEISTGFDFRLLVRSASSLLLRRTISRQNIKSVLSLVVFAFVIGINIAIARSGLSPSGIEPIAVSNYLKVNIPLGAVVETFESELIFLTPHLTFHVPSDLVSMQLNRKSSIDSSYPIDYDPMDAEPEYLVDGPMSQMWNLYDDVIKDDQFQLDADIGGYQIYKITASTPSK